MAHQREGRDAPQIFWLLWGHGHPPRSYGVAGTFVRYKESEMKSNWIYYGLILLTSEKIVQHIAVTLAFLFNWKGIRSTVVVSPLFLTISGAIVAGLFVISLWGLFKKRAWAISLLIFLAVFDMLGEFAAQGTLAIQLNISFLVAALLLTLSLVYRGQIQKK
jgi:hypothetical protein